GNRDRERSRERMTSALIAKLASISPSSLPYESENHSPKAPLSHRIGSFLYPSRLLCLGGHVASDRVQERQPLTINTESTV
ncbi:hypothetical protein U1Q18_008808, partial [Sarracenia purpurea var. burkii]